MFYPPLEAAEKLLVPPFPFVKIPYDPPPPPPPNVCWGRSFVLPAGGLGGAVSFTASPGQSPGGGSGGGAAMEATKIQ